MRTKRRATKRRAKSRSAKKRSSIRRDRGARAAHPLIVGVDGGNSKTDIILADTSGRLLAWVRVGGSNPQGIGLLPAAALLRSGIDAALARAKGVVSVVGLQARTCPALMLMKEQVAAGYVGEVVSVEP